MTSNHGRRSFSALVLLLATSVAHAAPPEVPDPTGDVTADESGIDWVQLYSGEWMQGSLDGLKLGDVDFDSEEFDTFTISFGDIETIWAPTDTEWILKGGERVVGPTTMVDGLITVYAEDGVHTFTPDDVNQMIGGSGSETSYWDFDAYIGVSARWGNSPQFSGTATTDLVRDDGRFIWDLHYIGNMGTSGGELIANNHNGNTKFSVYLTDIFYLTPVYGAGFRDTFANIAVRANAAAGMGIKHPVNRWFTWNGDLYAGYQYQLANEVPAGEEAASDDAAILAAVLLEFDPNGDLEIDIGWRSAFVVTSFGRTSHQGTLALSYDLTGALELTSKLIYDRIEEPPVDADGNQPLSDDLQLSIGLSVDL